MPFQPLSRRKLPLLLLSTIFFVLAMNFPQTLWFLIFVFLVPFLRFCETLSQGLFRLFLQTFSFGWLAIFFSTLWFAATFPLDWLKISDPILGIIIIGSLWIGFASIAALPIGLFGPIVRSFRSDWLFLNAVIGASIWTLLEYARSWLLAFATYGDETLFGPHHTYYALGYVLAHAPLLREILPIGGVWLGSFVIILINYTLFYGTSGKMTFLRSKEFFFLATFILAIIGTSIVTMSILRSSDAGKPSVPVSIVHSDLPSAIDKEALDKKGRAAYSLLEQLSEQSKIIVFPENFNILTPHSEEKKRFPNTPIVISSFSGQNSYNLFFLDTENDEIEYSKKQLLMPIGEYGVTWLRNLIRLTGDKKWLTMYDAPRFTAKKGAGKHLFMTPSLPNVTIGGTLCSENIAPEIYRGMTKNGATLLVNIASLAPFHGSDLLARQTLAINTARALENGRTFITASNRSPSFVVDDRGNTKNPIRTSQENIFSVIHTDTLIAQYTTPYVQFGSLIIPLSAIIVSIALIWKKRLK